MNYILKNENAIYYEVGYSCDNVIFLSLGSEKLFITDGRYKIEAEENLNNCEVIITTNLIKKAKDILRISGIKKIFFDPTDFNLLDYNSLSKKLTIDFIEKINFSRLKRVIKNNDEIDIIKKAVKIGKKAFNSFGNFLENEAKGLSEKNLDFYFKKYLSNYGELDLSFNPIIAINKNSAKPHSLLTQVSLKNKDLLLLDAGIKYKRYCSDRTRTLFYNEKKISMDKYKQNFKNKTIQKVYDIVLKSQEAGIKKAKAGIKAKDIDKACRDVIEKAGFGKYFIHSTGHGVGLDIHEYPFISSKSEMIIEENMVFTIEPGIYIPNQFGVRIEDMVMIKNSKIEVL